jgi:type VI protein secretion system component VasK
MTHWLTQTSAGFVFVLVAGIILLLALYLIPAILSYSLGSEHTKWILILNLTLGWTVLGWLAALIWAAMSGNDESFDEPAGDSGRQQNTKRIDPSL